MTTIALHTYLEEVNQLLDEDRFNDAARHCRHILKQFPRHVETYRMLAKALLGLDEIEPALDMFQRVLSADPNDLIAHIAMSELHARTNQPAQALWHLQRAFELQPYNRAIREELYKLIGPDEEMSAFEKMQLSAGALANLNVRSELYGQAIPVLRQELEAHPDRVDLEVLLAEALWRDGNRIEGARVARKVLQRLPNCIQANAILAHIWLGSSRASDARPYLQRLQGLVQMDLSHLDLDSAAGEALVAGRAASLPELIMVEPLGEEALLTDPTVEWSSDVSAAEATNGDVLSEPGDMYGWLSGISESGKVQDATEEDLKPPMETAVPGETNWFSEEATADDLTAAEESEEESVTNWLGSEWENVAEQQEEPDAEDIFAADWDAAAQLDEPTSEQPPIPDWLMTEEEDAPAAETAAADSASAADDFELVEDWAAMPETEEDDAMPDWLTDMTSTDFETVDPYEVASEIEESEQEFDEAADWLAELSGEFDQEVSDFADATADSAASEPAMGDSDVGDWLMDLAVDPGEELDFDSDLMADVIPSDTGLTGLLSTNELDWDESEEMEGAETAASEPADVLADFDAEEDAEEEPDFAAGSATRSEIDWLHRLSEETPAPIADDWLAEIAAEPTGFTDHLPEDEQAEAAAPSEPALPDPDDWLAALAASPGERIGDSDILQPDDEREDDAEDESDWLTGLSETAAADEAASEPASSWLDDDWEAEPETAVDEEDAQLDWLSDLSDEIESPLSGTDLLAEMEESSADAPEPELEADDGDWLADLASLETGFIEDAEAEPTAADLEDADDFDDDLEAAESYFDESDFDWLQTGALSESTNAEADVMDTGDDEKKEEPGQVPPIEPEAQEPETSDTEEAAWLSDLLDAADESDEKQVDDTWSGLDTDISLPAWMQEEEDETAVPNQPGDIPDWLKQPDTGDMAIVDEASAFTDEPAVEEELPSEDTTMLEAPPTQLLDALTAPDDVTDEAPDWLTDMGFDDLEDDEDVDDLLADEPLSAEMEELIGGTEVLPPPTELLNELAPELDDLDASGEDTGWLEELSDDEEDVKTPLPDLDWLDEPPAASIDLDLLDEEPEEAETAVESEELDEILDADLIPDVPSDLDDAMSWLEELAAEETAPVEPLPTVADVIDDELMQLDADEEEEDVELPAQAAADALPEVDEAMDELDDAMAWLDDLASDSYDEARPEAVEPAPVEAEEWLDVEAEAAADAAETAAMEEAALIDAEDDESTAVSAAAEVPKDLDDAMAWLEQLAANQGAPLDELPSLSAAAAAAEADEPAAEDEADWDDTFDFEAEFEADLAELEESELPDVFADDDDDWLDELTETAAEDADEAETAVDAMMADVPEDPEAAMAWLEELAARQGAPIEELPSLSTADEPETDEADAWEEAETAVPAAALDMPGDAFDEAEWDLPELEEEADETEADAVMGDVPEDINAAMAWLEELAARQGAPVEELPSLSAVDEDEEEEDFEADEEITAVLAEVEDIFVSAETEETLPELEEPEWEPEPELAAPLAADVVLDDELAAALDWLEMDALADEMDALPPAPFAVTPVSDDELAARLDRLEQMALQPSPLPAADEMETAAAPAPEAADELADLFDFPDDPDAALAWLEEAADDESEAAAAETVEVEAPFIESAAEEADAGTADEFDPFDIPDDPDAALAWLEEVADETEPEVMAEPPTLPFAEDEAVVEEGMGSETAVTEAPETLVMEDADAAAGDEGDLTDAFLSEVPEDPDEAMAWLEQLAARQGASLDELPTVSEIPEDVVTPDWVTAASEAEAAAAAAAAVEPPAPPEPTAVESAVEAPTAEASEAETPLFDEFDEADDEDVLGELPSWMGFEAATDEPAGDDIVDLPRTDWLKSVPELDVTGWLEAEDEASAESKDATGPLPDTGPLPELPPAPVEAPDTLDIDIDELALSEPDSSVYAVDEDDLSQAQTALAEGAYDQALTTFQSLVSRGEGMMVLIGELEGAVSEHADQPALRRLLGDAYMRNGQLQKALQTYRQALDQL